MPSLVTLVGTRCWVTLASDTDGPAVICGSQQSSGVDAPLDGEVRHYAGNRAQAIVRDQDDRTLALTLKHLSRGDRDLLLAWRGQVVLVRTMDAERFFAVYFNAPYRRVLRTTPEDGSDGDVTYDMDIAFQRVSWKESV